MRLQNRVAIITGAARGIGKAAAELFCREGATVVIWDLLDAGEETAAELRQQGFYCEFQKISTTDVPAVEAAARDVAERFGKIDVLVNNAGITRDKTLLKMSHLEWQQVIDVNLDGRFQLHQRPSRRSWWRRATDASSAPRRWWGFTAISGKPTTPPRRRASWRCAVPGRKKLGPKGITANAVAPGFIATDMTDAIPEEVRKQVIASIPVRRMGDPQDIAYAYLFLASDEAGFVNGQVLGVNGGQAS